MLYQYVVTFLISLLVSNAFALDLVPIDNPLSAIPAQHAHKSSKREASFTGDLDLQDFETFFWGAPAGQKLIYANLTVFFPEQYEYVIAMERFAGKLKSVKCEEDMMLEFNNDADFEYAKKQWNWVKGENNSFIMVTNYAGCADDMERLPFVVSDIRYDEVQNKAFLTADLKEWEEVVHSYQLHVGNMPLTPAHRMLMERGLMSRAADYTMSLVSGYDQNLFSTTVGGWTTSVDATIRTVGNLNVDFDVDVSWLKLKSAAMTITPEDVAASLQLALTEKGTLSKAYNWKKTVLSIPIQGITIAKVVKLGAFLDIDVGFTMEEWTGEAHANLGARMEISNSAIVKVDLVNSKNNKFSGWTPSFTPIPLTLSAKVEGSAEVYAEPNVKLEASALGKGWNVGLNMKMPYIAADFAAMYDSTGVCDTKKTLGVDIDAKIGVELSAQAATKGNEANPFWEQELYSHEWDLFSKCLAFGPSNAKSGEVVEPNPAPKTKKSKSSKPAKTKTSKHNTPTKKPTPTEDHKSSKPTPTPHSSSKRSSRPASDDATPTGHSSRRASKSGDDKSTKGPTTNPPKPSGTDGPSGHSSSKLPQSSGSDDPSGPKSSHSGSTADEPSGTTTGDTSKFPTTISTLSYSSSSFTTLTWTDSSRAHDGTVEPPQPSDDSSAPASSGADNPTPTGGDGNPPASTGGPGTDNSAPNATPSGGGDDNSPPAPHSGSSSPQSGVTPPPSTLSTVTSTSSSVSSTSSADSCPISGCDHCKDSFDMDAPTREYFDIEVDSPPELVDNLTARAEPHQLVSRKTRHYTFVCSHITEEIYMANYPQYADWARPNSPVTGVDGFYLASNVKDCLNHKISKTTSPPNPTGTPYFAMEHIYEGNWIVNFLRDLVDSEKVGCQEMKDIFFQEGISTNNARADSWIKAIMASLGSTVNQNLLVFLRQNINGAKYRIFLEGNDIIDEQRSWRPAAPTAKLEKLAVVGRAMDYLHQDDVGKKLKATAEKVEATLEALVAAAKNNEDLKKALGKYAEPGKLAKKHRAWLSTFMSERNEVARTSMMRWASEAYDTIDPTTPGHKRPTGAAITDPTHKSLDAWQTKAPVGFDVAAWL